MAWQLPEPNTADRQWVNNVTQTYLDHHDAACPDAIVHPHYYAQSFAPGTTGEIVITLEDAALTEYFVDPNSDGGLQLFGVVIEEVIGQSIVEVIDERVADELGLTDTVWVDSDE